MCFALCTRIWVSTKHLTGVVKKEKCQFILSTQKDVAHSWWVWPLRHVLLVCRVSRAPQSQDRLHKGVSCTGVSRNTSQNTLAKYFSIHDRQSIFQYTEANEYGNGWKAPALYDSNNGRVLTGDFQSFPSYGTITIWHCERHIWEPFRAHQCAAACQLKITGLNTA